ncbi:Acid phosphatase PHO1 [Leucoagaricus sp. SymC.cos]|nr:Acid phosphatase PHO1 [Leucoagaricus sp. SymC.cos]
MKLSAILSALSLIGIHIFGANAEAFNPLHHSGPASPYFDAPAEAGISEETPDGCVVDQAAYIVRHGSRYPEPGSFVGWQNLFEKFQNSSYIASGPLAFIPTWTPPVDDEPHEPLFLTTTGAREAFDLGVELRKRYRLTHGSTNFTIWSAAQQRVLDTASYFLRGYLSQGNYLSATSLNRGSIVSLPDSVNFTFADSLTSSSGCPNYNLGNNGSAQSDAFRSTFQNNIAKRLNRFLNGLALDGTDIGVMQDLCGFQVEINGDTRFCNVFEDSEWLDYEYAHDLNYYYGSGPGNPFSVTVGFGWLKAITDLFVIGPGSAPPNATFVPPPLIMSFTHDNNLPPIISALGVWNSSAQHSVFPLPATHIPSAKRSFRSSHLVTFRGYIALERLSCSKPLPPSVKHEAGKLVPINKAITPISSCTSGPGSSCPLKEFANYVNEDRAAAAGDFIEICDLQGVANATGKIDFFTQVTSANAQSLVIELPVS